MTEEEKKGATTPEAGPTGGSQFDSIGSGPVGVPADVVWVVEKIGWPVLPVHSIERGVCTCSKGKDCSTPGKHPRSSDGVKSATTDMGALASWASRWPVTNWGVEPRGGLVVDIDARHGGFDSIDQWDVKLPETTTVVTGGAGLHMYYTLPEGVDVPNRVGWLRGVDARSTGGYVLLPGGRYFSGGRYDWRDQRLPEVAPDELIDAIQNRASAGNSEALAANLVLLNGVPEGQRDSTIFRACCRWWRQFAHHDDDGAAAVIERAFEMGRNCDPPFPDEWIIAKVQSARRYAATDPMRRLSDDGNALLYVEQHGDLLRYATDAKQWHAWDGRRWTPKAEMIALDFARRTARSLVDFAKELEEDDVKRNQALKHAAASLGASRIEAMPRLAKSDLRVAISAGKFDTGPWLLNTVSGTVDLRTGVAYPHRREDFLTKITNIGYDPTAEATYWKQWLLWAMNGRQDLVDFLQRAVGYAITGDTSEQVFFLLHGSGANGKTTFLNVMEQILGDYAYHAEPELLTPKDGAHPTGVADLHGRRFVVASETREGKKLDERTVKALTGQDTITARRLYQDFFSFTPSHKIFFAVNHRPNITDDSYAMWRRVLLVPWEMRVEPDQQIRDVAERIVEHEGPGVLRWMIEGARLWRDEGGLMVPEDVKLKTTEYRVSEDAIGTFVEDRMERVDGATASTADVWSTYEMWCAAEGVYGKEKLGRNTLLSKIEDRLGVTKSRTVVNGQKIHGYQGWATTSAKIPASWG